jgi:hypothetical protein
LIEKNKELPIYKRFMRWKRLKIWSRMFAQSTDGADLQEIMLDGTIIRSHACSAGYQKDGNSEQALGRSKGGFTTKIYAMVDGLGNPSQIYFHRW